jgi:hypothetical protein
MNTIGKKIAKSIELKSIYLFFNKLLSAFSFFSMWHNYDFSREVIWWYFPVIQLWLMTRLENKDSDL